MLDRSAPERELRFSVELAQLAGFCSMTIGKRPVIHSPDEAGSGRGYLCASAGVNGEGIVPVLPGDDPVGAWTAAYEKCKIRTGRESDAPDGYVSATDNRQTDPTYTRTGGLERLFSVGWAMSDDDGDGLPDNVRLSFRFPNGMDAYICEAACCLAMRFGIETTSVRYPLVSETDDGDAVVFTRSDLAPEVRLERFGDRRTVVVEGSGEELCAFMRKFALSFSASHGAFNLVDAAEYLANALGGKNSDGDSVYISLHRPEGAVVGVDADIERLKARFEFCEVHAINEPVLALERRYEPKSEVDTALAALSRVLDGVKSGDKVELSGALWQSRDVRDDMAEQFSEKVRGLGADCKAKIVCAYKQGQSWFEESFAPMARAAGARSVRLRYDVGSASGVIYNADGLEIRDVTEKPPRCLRELYPADELAAKVIGIDSAAVSFEGVAGLPHSYEAEGFDAAGNLVCAGSYSVRTCARHTYDVMPELGVSLVPTGYLKVEINGATVLDDRIRTDAEALWDVFQTEVLPELLKRSSSGQQPYWRRVDVEAALGGVERELESGCDHISSGEMLEDSINQMAKILLMRKGRAEGRDMSCPGLILPLISTRDGSPAFAFRIYDYFADDTSSNKLEVKAECTRVTFEENGLWLHFDTDLPNKYAGEARELAALTEEGSTELSRALSGYEGITINCAGSAFSGHIPAAAEVDKASLSDIDMMPEEVIGYRDCERIVGELARAPELEVWRAAITAQGRSVWAIEPAWPCEGYVSRTKRLAHLPTMYINGRHHANEVSATNAAFAFLRKVLTECPDIYRRVNIVVVPMENADGAALHYELQKVHPNWQHQCCYTNSLGGDLMPAYFDPAPLTREALAFTRIADKYLPDAFVDLHGVPHHEIEGVFDAAGGYHGLWLPRALLCAFYYHVDDRRFASNRVLSEAWRSYVNDAMGEIEGFKEVNDRLEARFMKYSCDGIDEFYASERDGAMLNYWIPSPYNAAHPYPSISRPWVFSVMFTAEAADETAHGSWLAECAKAHVTHMLAGLKFMANTRTVMREVVRADDGEASIQLVRIRPILPPEGQNEQVYE